MAINPYDIQGIDSYALDDDLSTSLLPEEQQEKLKGNVGVPVFFGNVQTPEQNEFIDNVLALPRGFGKSAARMVAAEIPEGLWALTDLATNLTGFQDALDPKESAFLDRLQNVRDKIGYEESVPGKLGEALGSMAAFVGTTLVTGGVAGALSGAGKAAQAAKLFQTGKLIKAAKASPSTFAFMSSPGYMFAAGEQQLRMKARERAGDDIEIGDRNLALALAIPVGISEFIPIGRIFGGMKRSDVSPEKFFEYQEILKRGFRSAGEEGLQEAGAGIMQDLIEQGIYNPDAAIGETWASEFGYGAGAGGLFSLALNIANRKSRRWGESGDPDDLIKDLPAEELAEVEKQAGLDTTTEDQSDLSKILAGEDIELRSDIVESEANIPEVTPEVDPIIPVADDVNQIDEINNRIDKEIDELDWDLGRGNAFLDAQEAERKKGNIKVGRIDQEYRDKKITSEEYQRKKEKANSRRKSLENYKKQLAAIIIFRNARGIDGEIDQNKLDEWLKNEIEINELLDPINNNPDQYTEEDLEIWRKENEPRLREILASQEAIVNDLQTGTITEKDVTTPVADEVVEEVTETTTEPAEAAPEVTVEEEVKEKTAKPKKAKPAKRIDLNQKITNPVNKKSVDVGFADEQSARVYGDGQKQTKRLVEKKTKKVINESAAFRKSVKDNLGLNTQAYRDLNTRYTDYIKKGADNAMKGNQPEFKPVSFADYVNQEIGVATPKDIVQTLKNKNISTADSDFKKYLKQRWKADSLDQLNTLNRREAMRNISSLPTMDRKNSSIAKAFGVQGDNLKIASRESAIEDRARKLSNNNTQIKLVNLAQATGVPYQEIYDKDGNPLTKRDIAKRISTREVDSLTTAEELQERMASVVVPNLTSVRKKKQSNKEKADNIVKYNVKFPDQSKVQVAIPAILEGQQARDQAALLAVEERADQLRKENEKKKVAPEASERDYVEAIKSMLVSGYSPLGILKNKARPKFSTTARVAGESIDIPMPSAEILNQPDYVFKEGVDSENIIRNMRRDVRRIFPDANVGIVDQLFTEQGRETAGITLNDLILISLDNKFSKPNETLYHEAVHYFVNNGFFSNEDINALRENESRIRNIAEAREGKPVESFEEAVAIASGVYNSARQDGRNPYEFLPPMRRAFDKLYKLFNRFKQFLNRKKYRTPEQVFDRIREGTLFKEALESENKLTNINKEFVEDNFQKWGTVGRYTGGQLIQQMTPEYKQYTQGIRPFFINDRAFIRPIDSVINGTNMELFVVDELKQKIKGLNIKKKIKGSEWAKHIFGGKALKQAYNQDANLKDYLNDNANEELSKADIMSYVDSNTDVYSVEMHGNDLNYFPVAEAEERIAYQQVQNELNVIEDLISRTTDQLRILAIENGALYKALGHNSYNGPTGSRESAFYNAVQTDRVIKEWKYNAKRKDFPLEITDKDFKFLKDFLHPEVSSPDFQTSPEVQSKAEDIIARMFQPFVKVKINETYDENDKLVVQENLEISFPWYENLPRQRTTLELEKFLVDLKGRSNLSIDENGKVQIAELSLINDNLIEYINKFNTPEEIDYFTKENGFTGEAGDAYNINQLLKDNLYLRERHKLFYEIMTDPKTLATPQGLELSYRKFNSLQDPKYGNYPFTAIPKVDPLLGPISRHHARQAALARGEELPKKYGELRTLAGIGRTQDQPSMASPSDVEVAMTAFTPDELGEGDAEKSWRISWNNIAHDNYREFVFYHRPSNTSQMLFNEYTHLGTGPGSFAHTRVRDIFGQEGKKYLFIEEMQSDYLNGLKNALKSKFSQENLVDPYGNITASKEQLKEAFKEIRISGDRDITYKDFQQIPLLNMSNPDFTNSYQDFMARFLVKIALDNNYDGIRIINPNLQAERISESLQYNFDNLYYLSSVNPADMYLQEADGKYFYYHKPSGQRITIEELEERPDIYTFSDFIPLVLKDDNIATSGKMAAANLLAERFSVDPSSFEYTKYVNYARLIGMQGSNVAQDFAIPINYVSDPDNLSATNPNQVTHHDAIINSKFIRDNNTINYIRNDNPMPHDVYKKQFVGSILPAQIADIIKNQIKLAIPPDFQRNNISSLSPNDISETEFDPNRIRYQQNSLEGIGNGYFNFRSMSPEILRGFSKQGFSQYGNPMVSRFKKALNAIDNGKSFNNGQITEAGKGMNEIAAELFDGAKIKDINSNDWWANRLFSETYKGMEGRFPEVIEVTEREENQGLSRRQFLKTVIAGTALVNVPKSLVPVDTIRKHIERIGGLDSIMYENHPIDYIEDLKSMLIDDQETGENTGLEMLKDLYETMEVPFTQEELLQENGASEKFVSTYRRYRGVMEPYLDIALDRYTKKQEKQKQERIREETEDVVYDELSEAEQNQVAMEKMRAQLLIESKAGDKPAANEFGMEHRPSDSREVGGDRFRFRGFNFGDELSSKYGRQRPSTMAKYSSTPADAQRAYISLNTWEKATNLTRLFSGLGKLPNYKKLMYERHLALGNLGKAYRAADFFYHKIAAIVNPTKGKDSPEKQQLRRELTEFMEGGWDASPEIISDTNLRKLAIKAKTMIDNIGKLLVNKGLLPRDVYEKSRGEYLPKLYMKYLINNPTGGTQDYLKKRKDLDDETRMILGDIADISPEFRIHAGIARPLRDIAMLDFFETVSNDQGWALKDNDIMVTIPTPDGKPMNVSALWLQQEADRLMAESNQFSAEPETAAQMKEKATEFYDIAAPMLRQTNYGKGAVVINGKVSKDWRRIPATKKYGMLQGVPVRKEIYNDIIGTFTIGDTDNFYNKSVAVMKKGVSIWKNLKVPMNPPTVVRNVGSNMILMNIVGGVPIHKVLPRMKQSIDQISAYNKALKEGATEEELKRIAPAWHIALKFGIKSTQFSDQELYQISEVMLDLHQQHHQLGPITKFFSLPKLLGQKILKKGGDLYQFTESVGKTAIIIDAMDKGMGEFEAFHLAQKALFDYSDLPAGGKAFRSAPIGMPFFTFYYKAFPALIEVALTNPMRFAPYIALTAGLSALTGFAFGFEDDDDKKLKKSLEPWIERRTGVHVLPWKDSDGRFQFIDIGFFFPWTMYADAVKGAYNGEFMELQRTTGLFSGPFSDILLAMKTNRDPFTQRVIWDERDPVEERIKSLMWYTYGMGMPSWLTPNGAISKTVKALQDTPRPTGQPADTVPQALLRFVGVNVYGLEPRETRQRNIKRMRQDIEDTRSRMRWTMRNQSLDQETKNARRVKYLSLIRQKQQEMAQYMHDTSLPEGLLNRKSRFQD